MAKPVKIISILRKIFIKQEEIRNKPSTKLLKDFKAFTKKIKPKISKKNRKLLSAVQKELEIKKENAVSKKKAKKRFFPTTQNFLTN